MLTSRFVTFMSLLAAFVSASKLFTNPTTVCANNQFRIECQNTENGIFISHAIFGPISLNASCVTTFAQTRTGSQKPCFADVRNRVGKLCDGRRACNVNLESFALKNCPKKLIRVTYYCPNRAKIVNMFRNYKMNKFNYKNDDYDRSDIELFQSLLMSRGKTPTTIDSKTPTTFQYFNVSNHQNGTLRILNRFHKRAEKLSNYIRRFN